MSRAEMILSMPPDTPFVDMATGDRFRVSQFEPIHISNGAVLDFGIKGTLVEYMEHWDFSRKVHIKHLRLLEDSRVDRTNGAKTDPCSLTKPDVAQPNDNVSFSGSSFSAFENKRGVNNA